MPVGAPLMVAERRCSTLGALSVPLPSPGTWLPLLDLALQEDVGAGDATSNALVPATALGTARIEARAALRVCGLPVARAVFERVDAALEWKGAAEDGDDADAGVLAHVSGSLRSILCAERTALNFLGRMCGVATLTRTYVDAIEGLPCRVVDTRKTLPGWRSLDKYATAVGGAENHRAGLYDALLLKDNHLAFAGGAARAYTRARDAAPSHLRIQVEVESAEEARAAAGAGADWLLLDNCSPALMRDIAAELGDRALLEASGGVTLGTIREIAETGVHRISVGALTHSAPVADVALEIDGVEA